MIVLTPGLYISVSLYNYSSCVSSVSQALANIPSVSESTLRRDIADSGISLDASIQVSCMCTL